MVFRVSANAQTAGLDIREAKADGLAKGSRIHVWDPIMIAYAAVRIIEALTGNIAFAVRGVVRIEPVFFGN
jgi:hypothetical protein